MITIKGKGNTNNLVVLDANGNEIKGISKIEFLPLIPDKKMEAKLTFVVDEIDLDVEVKGQKEKFDPTANIPVVINADAWMAWVDFRSRILKKPLTERSCKLQWEDLAKLTQPRQVDCLQHSIKQGYTGIFPDKFAKGRSTRDIPIADDLLNMDWAE